MSSWALASGRRISVSSGIGKSRVLSVTRTSLLATAMAAIVASGNESYPDLHIASNDLPFASIDETYPEYVFASLSNVRGEMHTFYAPTKEMVNPKIKWNVLCEVSDSLVRGMEFYGDKAYAITEAGSPKYKLISTSIAHPDWRHAETVLPEQKDAMQDIVKSKDYLLAVYSDGIVGRAVAYHFSDGKAEELSLPMTGAIGVMCPDQHTNHFIVTISTWTSPRTLYDYDADSHSYKKSIFNFDISYPGFENLTSEEVEVPGHDGAMIPLSIIYKKGIEEGWREQLHHGWVRRLRHQFHPLVQYPSVSRPSWSRSCDRTRTGRE